LRPGATPDQAQAAFEELMREYPPGRFSRFDDPEIHRAAAAILELFQRSLKKLRAAPSGPSADQPDLAAADSPGTAGAAPPREPPSRPSGLLDMALFDDIEVGSDEPGAAALTALRQRTVLPGSRTLSADWKIVNVHSPEEEPQPGSAAAFIAQAREHLEQERLEAAARDLKNALALDPDNRKAQAYLNLIDARRLKRKGEFKQAIAKYRAALDLDETVEEAARELRQGRR
jgi:tetratricopeptide (TPR) repeat protein